MTERDIQSQAGTTNFGADAEAVRQVEMSNKCTYLVSRPSALGIEPTTHCNLRCKMCPQWSDRFGKEFRGHVSEATFDAVREFFPYVSVFFGGLGEPLVHPRFLAMLECTAREARGVSFITNATLLTRDVARLLLDLKVEKVIVSIDARTPALYQQIRGFPLETVLQNVRTLMEMRRRSHSPWPVLSVNFTMMRLNALEMPAVAELAAGLGADEVTYGHLECLRFNPPEFLKKEYLDYADPEVQELVRQTREVAFRLGIRVEFPDFAAILSKYETLTPTGAWTKAKSKLCGEERLEAISVDEACETLAQRLKAAGLEDSDIEEVPVTIWSQLLVDAHERIFAHLRATSPSVGTSSATGRNRSSDTLPPPSVGETTRLCDDAFRALFISQAGDVYLNCESYHLDSDLLGNLREQRLSEIWNGGPIRKLRRWWHSLQDGEAAGVGK